MINRLYKSWGWLRWVVSIVFTWYMVASTFGFNTLSDIESVLTLSLMSTAYAYINLLVTRKLSLWIARRPELEFTGVGDTYAYYRTHIQQGWLFTFAHFFIVTGAITQPTRHGIPALIWFAFWVVFGLLNTKIESSAYPL